MEQWKVKNLYSLSETIAADIFEGVEYPWEALGKIKDFIMELGAKLPEEKYEKRESQDEKKHKALSKKSGNPCKYGFPDSMWCMVFVQDALRQCESIPK